MFAIISSLPISAKVLYRSIRLSSVSRASHVYNISRWLATTFLGHVSVTQQLRDGWLFLPDFQSSGNVWTSRATSEAVRIIHTRTTDAQRLIAFAGHRGATDHGQRLRVRIHADAGAQSPLNSPTRHDHTHLRLVGPASFQRSAFTWESSSSVRWPEIILGPNKVYCTSHFPLSAFSVAGSRF